MNSRYIYVSDNYNRNFDLIGVSLLDKYFSVTLHPGYIPLCTEAGMHCFENPGKLILVTLSKHNGEGGFVSTQWEMKAFLKADQEPEGIFCIGYNITELVSAKIEIESKRTKFQKSVLHSHMGFAGRLPIF
jgi:hypothetical protein